MPGLQQQQQALDHLTGDCNERGVLEALSHMIEKAGLGIGDRLPPEVEIAKRLGVSRAKVREALTAWQNMGIVTRNRRAGTRLAAEVSSGSIHLPITLKLEAESLLRTHAVRRPLEIEATRLAALNASDPERREILHLADKLLAQHAGGADWRLADHRFHSAIHDASGNPLFAQLIHQIQRGFGEIYEAPFGQPHLGEGTIPLHLPLAQAIAEGNISQSIEIMEKIMEMVAAEVHQVMEREHG